jgi:hypothetical protein
MKKIIRLTERDLEGLVRKVLNESDKQDRASILRDLNNTPAKIKTTLREYLNENYNMNELKNVLNKLGIYDFEILGVGQHGAAILNRENNKVYKFTKSINEFNIAKKQYENQIQTLPKIYDIGVIDDINYYVRDMFTPISDDFAEKIGEEYDDLDEFFYSNVRDVRKSQTNLSYNFDDKFLNFLNNLKKDLRKLGINDNFDVDGMTLNVYLNNDGDYILVDF